MNKRALMLTAAVSALLSGHAYAASPCDTSTSTTGNCDITTGFSYPLYTGTVDTGVANSATGLGNITLDTDSVLTIGTNPPTAPAITINSGTATAPAEVNNTTQINYEGISYAVGVLLEEASVPTSTTTYGTAEYNVGEFYNSSGTVDMLGGGTAVTGILIAGGAYPGAGLSDAETGTYANSSATGGLGLFTGATDYEPTGSTRPVAIYLGAGSVVEIQGLSSYGINLIGPTYTQSSANNNTYIPSGGASLLGDIDIAGTLQLEPTTVGSLTATDNIAINIAGWMQASGTSTAANPAFNGTAYQGCACAMVGNINIYSGGVVSNEGAGVYGLVVEGAINGAIVNNGQITTFGTTAPSTALNADDPEGSSAVVIANNVTGGIYNGGPDSLSDTTSRATLSMDGNTYTLEISPTYNGEVQVPITIGGYTDQTGDTYSLFNRGNITASAEDANVGNTAIYMLGQNEAAVLIQDGIFNSGTISSSATTNTDGSTTDTAVTATALSIGNFVTVGTGGTTVNGVAYSLVNTNETGAGSISATISGAQTGTATAILISGASSGAVAGSLQSIFNSGTISATATTTNLLSTGIAAYGIYDQSGTLTTIYNTGTISAAATTLDNNEEIADAIDTSSNSKTSVIITDQSTASNSANIYGDIHFGAMAGTLTIAGIAGEPATVSGDLYFNNSSGTDDTLTVGQYGNFSGEISETSGGTANITVDNTGTLTMLTTLASNINSTVSVAVTKGAPLSVGTLSVATGGTLDISVSQGYNTTVYNGVSIIDAQNVSIGNPTGNIHPLEVSFGGYVGSPSNAPSQFVLIESNHPIQISTTELNDLATLYNGSTTNGNNVPFLFTSSVCAYNTSSQIAATTCSAAEPNSTTASEIVMTLTPKTAAEIGLTGNAAKISPYVNEALVNDNTLGAAMITDITNQSSAQAAYASFAPDVSGATRATAISLTDSATNVVAARQRELLMYANMEGETTLWGQQFGERLSQANSSTLTGYNDDGFGFVMGMDEGDAVDGRYGGAFTFFAGGMSEKEPVSAKTESEYYLLTAYSEWRGKGLFFDTQGTVGYGNLKGKRYLTLTDATTNATVSREADGDRPTEMLSGGMTTGGIFDWGGTVFMPQVAVDGLTLREEGYTEQNGGEGFDLHVQPYYADSLRAFVGTDIRQDFNFGDFYFQPSARVGYRYDFVDGAVKLKANFASVGTLNDQTYDPFTVEGPDPGHGNIVLGGGAAITTGTWSIGINYDYVRAGNGPTEQTGVLTLVGRI